MTAMKRAWEIRKEAAVKFECKVMGIDFSCCLKMAWAEIKGEVKMEETLEEKIERAMAAAEAVVESSEYANCSGEYWYSTKYNNWKNKRIYINMSYGRRNKWNRGVSYCCDIEKLTMFDSSRGYGNAGEGREVIEAAKAALEIMKG